MQKNAKDITKIVKSDKLYIGTTIVTYEIYKPGEFAVCLTSKIVSQVCLWLVFGLLSIYSVYGP